MAKELPLGGRRGGVVIVDDQDYEALSQHRWFYDDGYVSRTIRSGEAGFRDWRHPTRLSMHRLLLGLERGDSRQADHINGNRRDNRRSNLRIVTPAQNHQNIPPRHSGSSRHRGVRFDRARGNWRVSVARRNFGSYPDEETAAEVARQARRLLMPFSVERTHDPNVHRRERKAS